MHTGLGVLTPKCFSVTLLGLQSRAWETGFVGDTGGGAAAFGLPPRGSVAAAVGVTVGNLDVEPEDRDLPCPDSGWFLSPGKSLGPVPLCQVGCGASAGGPKAQWPPPQGWSPGHILGTQKSRRQSGRGCGRRGAHAGPSPEPWRAVPPAPPLRLLQPLRATPGGRRAWAGGQAGGPESGIRPAVTRSGCSALVGGGALRT